MHVSVETKIVDDGGAVLSEEACVGKDRHSVDSKDRSTENNDFPAKERRSDKDEDYLHARKPQDNIKLSTETCFKEDHNQHYQNFNDVFNVRFVSSVPTKENLRGANKVNVDARQHQSISKEKMHMHSEEQNPRLEISEGINNPSTEMRSILAKENQRDEKQPDLQPQDQQNLQRNVLLLGTAGSGKYTIAKNIATDHTDDFPPKYAYKGVGFVHEITFNQYKFAFIDTAGIQLDDHPQQIHKLNTDTMRKEIAAILPGIHLILLVVRNGCCVPDELDALAIIVGTLFTKETRKYIALIHSACENLHETAKINYIENFAAREGPSHRLHSMCGNVILAVGFPNLVEASEAYIHLYKKTIDQSVKSLRDLCKSNSTLQLTSNIFPQNTLDEKVHSLLFPNTKCPVM